MACDCETWIKNIFGYNDVLNLLVWKNKDCVLVDIGCGYNPNLHEIKRHLKKHDIECRTVGIDVLDEDIEVDLFLMKSIYEVNMDNIADVVICNAIFTMAHSETGLKGKRFFSDKTIFKQCVDNCANMLKNDGVMIISLMHKHAVEKSDNNDKYPLSIKIMNKSDVFKHASDCCNKFFEDCDHGLSITYNTEPNDVVTYLPWLPPLNNDDIKNGKFSSDVRHVFHT